MGAGVGQDSTGPVRLVGYGWDGLMVGWLAVAVWVAVFLSARTGILAGSHDLSVVVAVGAVLTAAHFGVSYHLAYGDGLRTAARERPVAMAVAPVLMALVLLAVVAVSLSAGAGHVQHTMDALVSAVYLMTTWHYIKQVYGVARVGAAFTGVRLGTWQTRILRYGLYPMWFLGAAQILVRRANYGFAGYSVGIGVLPGWTYHALRLAALASAVPVAAVLAGTRAGVRRVPPSLMLAPYTAAVLWLAVPTSPLLTLVLLAPFHALQYLAIAHRAEVSVASSRPGRRGAVWWLNVFGGAAAGGLLASRWLPQFLDVHLLSASTPRLFTAAIFVFLNLHHYLIDATIWRSKGSLVKAVVRGPQPAAGVTSPAAAVPVVAVAIA